MSENRENTRQSNSNGGVVRLKQPTDDKILTDLDEVCRDLPGNIADRIDRHPTYVSDRLKQLEDYGLVYDTGRSVFKLTDMGQAYVEGDIAVSDIEN